MPLIYENNTPLLISPDLNETLKPTVFYTHYAEKDGALPLNFGLKYLFHNISITENGRIIRVAIIPCRFLNCIKDPKTL